MFKIICFITLVSSCFFFSKKDIDNFLDYSIKRGYANFRRDSVFVQVVIDSSNAISVAENIYNEYYKVGKYTFYITSFENIRSHTPTITIHRIEYKGHGIYIMDVSYKGAGQKRYNIFFYFKDGELVVDRSEFTGSQIKD